MSTVITEIVEGRIAVLTLNRPERLNAATVEMFNRLEESVHELNSNNAIAAVIITGAGKAFCAGRDTDDLGDVAHADRVAAIPEPGGHQSDAIGRLQMPTIAAVNGVAVGAGVGFMLQCDIRIGSQKAAMRDGHVSAGMIPSVASWYLPRLIGVGAALQVFFDENKLDAERMLALGILSEIALPETLLDRAIAIARTFGQWPTELVRHTKLQALHAVEERYEQSMERVGLLRGLGARGRAERPS